MNATAPADLTPFYEPCADEATVFESARNNFV